MEPRKIRIEKSRKKKKGKILLYAFIIFFIALGGVGAYVFKMYREIVNATDNIHNEVAADDIRNGDINVPMEDPFSILLLGIDEDLDSNGRSDSIMVVTVNPNEDSTKILSIPRDTLVEIVGHGTKDKINHAYAFGGAEMSINTVQSFLDIPIDYYVEIDMEGIKELVDAVGGIIVENNLRFSYDGDTFEIGTLELNGLQALNYARMRKDDPNGDFGRQVRQRQVIAAIVNELINFSAVTEYDEILNAIKEHMRTNFTLDEIISISTNYRSVLNQIEELQLIGTSKAIDGVYYQIVSDEEVSEISTELRKHLELAN